MSPNKGIASYCQECGRCNAIPVDTIETIDDNLVEIIVDEVIKTIYDSGDRKKPVSIVPLIPLGVSNHHVHITRATFEKLFGAGAELETYRELYQPGR